MIMRCKIDFIVEQPGKFGGISLNGAFTISGIDNKEAYSLIQGMKSTDDLEALRAVSEIIHMEIERRAFKELYDKLEETFSEDEIDVLRRGFCE